MDVTDLVERIHDRPQLLVMNFAGAGVQALAWLHSVGGSSRTVLEAVDRYSVGTLREATGFVPDQFTSLRVGKALAEHAWSRAAALAEAAEPGLSHVVVGVGLTATIATDRPKRGDHRMVLATRDAFGVVARELVLAKGERTRAEEEDLVSLLTLRAIAGASGILDLPGLALLEGERVETTFDAALPVRAFECGDRPWLRLEPDGRWSEPAQQRGLALVSGNFHPVHDGHWELARVAAEAHGREVAFELPVANAEKGLVPMLEVRRRAAQFALRAPLLLTRAPLFVTKAELFPDALFVVGADTAMRVVDPGFYGGSRQEMAAALERIRAAGGRFLVAGRKVRDAFVTLADVPVPEGFGDLFEGLPEQAFRRDVSSTDIRRGWAGRAERGSAHRSE